MPALFDLPAMILARPNASGAWSPIPSRGTEGDFDAGPAADLLSGFLPQLAGVSEKLRAGARVAHLGCGEGMALILLAMANPQSQFLGFDNDTAALAAATRAAQEAGVAHRVTFQTATAADFTRHQGYDLVFLSQGLCGLAHPITVARHVRQTLKIAGTWMILEPRAADESRLRDILAKAGFKSIHIAARTPALHIVQARP